MKKILFIVSHRKNRAPGQRFRFEQYIDYLNQNGFQCDISFLLSEKDDKILYKEQRYFEKSLVAVKCFGKRITDLSRASHYDIIFIYREAFMLGTTFFEKRFKKSGAKIVFDFDDAIWLHDISEANKKFSWMKRPEKTADIVALADMVFAGNSYLAEFASFYNHNIKLVPTTIDTNEYCVSTSAQIDNERICIGWSGSITTIKHFEYALPILEKLKTKYQNKICFKVIGDASYVNQSLGIQGKAWSKENEINDLREFDIGIMPLPNDEWAKGKCGLKGLQYMALEIPTIMSPVGVNKEIIRDGENGFLAESTDEWINKLSLLLESKELRNRLGKNGRQTVVEKYSVESLKEKYLQYFNEVINRSER